MAEDDAAAEPEAEPEPEPEAEPESEPEAEGDEEKDEGESSPKAETTPVSRAPAGVSLCRVSDFNDRSACRYPLTTRTRRTVLTTRRCAAAVCYPAAFAAAANSER